MMWINPVLVNSPMLSFHASISQEQRAPKVASQASIRHRQACTGCWALSRKRATLEIDISVTSLWWWSTWPQTWSYHPGTRGRIV